jgi:hypothetical protein
LEVKVSSEFVRDQFRRQELRNAQDLATRDSKEKGDWVEYIANDKFKGQVVDAEASSDPGEKTINTVVTSLTRISSHESELCRSTYAATKDKTVSTLVLATFLAFTPLRRRETYKICPATTRPKTAPWLKA